VSGERPDVLSSFWAPVCAVGSHGPAGPNAQISVSVFGASIVPEQPRLIAGLYKTNFTTGLVEAAGTLAISLLGERQAALLERLGIESGRDGDKMAGLDFRLTASGDPYFPDAAALIDCRVIDAMDAGDALFFLCAVTDRCWLTDQEPLDRFRAIALAGARFWERWPEKQATERAISRTVMRW